MWVHCKPLACEVVAAHHHISELCETRRHPLPFCGAHQDFCASGLALVVRLDDHKHFVGAGRHSKRHNSPAVTNGQTLSEDSGRQTCGWVAAVGCQLTRSQKSRGRIHPSAGPNESFVRHDAPSETPRQHRSLQKRSLRTRFDLDAPQCQSPSRSPASSPVSISTAHTLAVAQGLDLDLDLGLAVRAPCF